jgi:hypothetical protein
LLVRDLWRAHAKYIIRTKLDSAVFRVKVLNDLVRTGIEFRNALTQFELASKKRQIALPPEIPEGLDAQSLARLLTSCKAAIKEYRDPAIWKRSINATARLGLEKSSALEFFLGALLPPIFNRHYKREVKLRLSDGFPDTPFIRFAIVVCKQCGVVGRSGKPPKRETVVKSCSLYRKAGSRRKSV